MIGEERPREVRELTEPEFLSVEGVISQAPRPPARALRHLEGERGASLLALGVASALQPFGGAFLGQNVLATNPSHRRLGLSPPSGAFRP